MYRFSILLILSALFCCGWNTNSLYAQERISWDDFIERYLADEEYTDEAREQLYQSLTELHDHPQNLNRATKEELDRMPFLNDEAVEEILAYIYRFGPMKSMGELDLIPKLDYTIRQTLPLFFYVDQNQSAAEPKKGLRGALKYGRNEVIARVDIPLYKRAGYQNYSDSILERYPNRKYLGGPLYTSLRYQFNYRNRLLFGLTAEKDAGEPFGTKGNRWGYDYYAFHLMIKDIGVIKTLAIGDYRINFGEGLVVNTDFCLGISSLLTPAAKAKGIKRHASTGETNFFRGGALTLGKEHIEGTLFVSYRAQDATMNRDSLTVSSIKEDGYHRTPLEMSKKGNIHNWVIGGNIAYKRGPFKAGITGIYNRYNRELNPGTYFYQHFNPHGKTFYTIGVDYGYRHPRIAFQGETARSGNGGLATTNRLQLRINSSYQILLMQRFFSLKFNSIYAQTIAEGGDVRNESGLFIGLLANPIRRLQCTFYADFFYHPWAKYQVSRSSYGRTFYGQARYTFNTRTMVLLQYRIKRKQKDFEVPTLAYQTRQTAKMQVEIRPNSRYLFRSTIDYAQSDFKETKTARGFRFAQAVWVTGLATYFQAGIDISLFFTDSYDSRIYAYERSLLYTFNFPSYYYHGLRTALMLRADLGMNWMIIAKYGMTDYFNKRTISSSQQLINSRYKNDIQLQARVKF